MRIPLAAVLVALALCPAAVAGEDYAAWPVLTNPFPSTGGGGVMIDGYKPVVSGGRCRTDFTATDAGGTVYRNTVEFEAVEADGGILCTGGKWRALDGGMSGTTPFRMFIKDGVVRRAP